MTLPDNNPASPELDRIYARGWRAGVAAASIGAALISVINLLGIEKASLAIVLGALAVRGAERGTRTRRLGLIAIAVGIVFVITVAIVLALFWKRFAELVHLLRTLG